MALCPSLDLSTRSGWDHPISRRRVSVQRDLIGARALVCLVTGLSAQPTNPALPPEIGYVTIGIIGGVDTHTAFHCAAAIDTRGCLLGVRQFPATAEGYRRLERWLRSFGELAAVGVEGTGAYGAGLARHLRDSRIKVVEVPRPDRRTRRANGKSDPIDAEAAARAVLAGTATTVPNTRTGPWKQSERFASLDSVHSRRRPRPSTRCDR